MGDRQMTPTGVATFEIIRRRAWVPEALDARMREPWHPQTRFGEIVKACFVYLPRDLALILLDEIRFVLIGETSLAVAVTHRDGTVDSWGVVSRKVITNAGVAQIIDALQGLASISVFNYHGLGTGSSAESTADTTLGVELTTQYPINNVRGTGLVSEPTPSAYRTQATIAVDAAVTIREHGIFSQAAAPGGTLLDRSLTGGQDLAPGDGLLSTWTFTLASGG